MMAWSNAAKIRSGVVLLFLLLTIVHLLPLSVHPVDHANDLKDSLLNAWIVAWVQSALLHHPAALFDANIFYPYPNTLSYSEHLFPLAVLSLPVTVLFHNPVLTSNVLLLAFFFLNAYAMFLLVKSLTDNDWAGILSGVVFAFNTYQMQHLAHLQLLSSWCIPLAFLYLHKFFKTHRWKDSLLFALFFTLQALSAVYYGLFFISVLIVVLPVLMLLDARPIQRLFLIRLLSPLLLSSTILLLFSLPYFSLFKTFNFQRDLRPGADLMNYFAVRPDNILFGSLLHPLGSHERFLFAGLAAVFLASLFLAGKRNLLGLIPRIPRFLLLVSIGAGAAGCLVLLVSGGFDLDLGKMKISGHRLDRYAIPLFLGAIGLLIFSFANFLKKKRPGTPEAEQTKVFFTYAFLVVWSLFLSFGSAVTLVGKQAVKGKSIGLLLTPFRWFYDLGIGFKGIRVPSRYAVFVIFGLAVMAGFGFTKLWGALNNKRTRVALASSLLLFMNVEYLFKAQKAERVPTGKVIPVTYDYLKNIPDEFALAELPFLDNISRDALYMYFSLFHQKKIVNGYSGFLPPATLYTREVFRQFPTWECFEILKALEVRYVLLHANALKEAKRVNVFEKMNRLYPQALREIRTFCYPVGAEFEYLNLLGKDILYEVTAEDIERPRIRGLKELSPNGWSGRSDWSPELLPFLKDGRMETAWMTPRGKKTGDTLHIGFSELQEVAQIHLHVPPKHLDVQFAVCLEVKTSLDGKRWRHHEYAYAPGEFARNLVDDPKNPVQKIYLDGRPIRFLRIIQFGWEKHAPWSIAEMKIFVKSGDSTDKPESE